jgi:hypothetical protein
MSYTTRRAIVQRTESDPNAARGEAATKHPLASQVATARSEIQVQAVTKEIAGAMTDMDPMIALRVTTGLMIGIGDIGTIGQGEDPVAVEGIDSRIDTRTIENAGGRTSCTISKILTSEIIGISASLRLWEEDLAWQKTRRHRRGIASMLRQMGRVKTARTRRREDGGKKTRKL